MIIMALGDLHITDRQPKGRRDVYFETVCKKLEFIKTTAKKEHAEIIIQPGDLFDSFKESDFLKQEIIRILSTWKQDLEVDVFTVFGQHDLRYHSTNRLNTPTAILKASNSIKLLNRPRVIKYDSDKSSTNITLYGFSWGDEEIPKLVDEKGTHILVIHSMIIESEKLWPQQEEYSRGSLLLKRFGFDYIISGDNHKSFYVKGKEKMLINCGSLMRKNVDQKDHKPCLWIIDTEERGKEKQIFIPIEPSEKVLSFEEYENKKEENKNLTDLLNKIKGGTRIEGLEFKKNVIVRLSGVRKSVQKITNEIMEEASNADNS